MYDILIPNKERDEQILKEFIEQQILLLFLRVLNVWKQTIATQSLYLIEIKGGRKGVAWQHNEK